MTCVWRWTNPLLRFSGLLILLSFVSTAIVVAAADSICCCWLDCVDTLIFVFWRSSWISLRHQMDQFAALGNTALARLLVFREATALRRQAFVFATFSTLAWSLICFEGCVSALRFLASYWCILLRDVRLIRRYGIARRASYQPFLLALRVSYRPNGWFYVVHMCCWRTWSCPGVLRLNSFSKYLRFVCL